ncbi:MAG TPA: MFS transporter [Rhabdochlamydiaceae bacterium]|jgi:MFS family permease
MRKLSTSARYVGIIGNILEHYDNALFALLAPFVASLFFEKNDPLMALILTYGMLPLGIVFRPLGSLFFGWIGDRYGRRRALCASLLGMAVITVIMGSLPLYATAGILSPLLLALCRVGQNFCAAGENVGASIFILEHTEEPRKNFISSIYNASTIAGTLIASILVSLCSFYWKDMPFWRWLYWSGGITALVVLPIRYKLTEGVEFIKAKQTSANIVKVLSLNWKPLLAILCVAGFSYTTYSLPFTFMNGYIPLVTSMTKAGAVHMNTCLLVLDMCTLPFFGVLASKYSKEKIMLISALFTCVSSIPLFYLLPSASLPTILAIRMLIVLCGVGFSATYYSWIQELVLPQYRYTILSTGHAIGSQLIGAPTSAISLWLFQKTGWAGAPALYLMITSFLAAGAVYLFSYKRKFRQTLVDTTR